MGIRLLQVISVIINQAENVKKKIIVKQLYHLYKHYPKTPHIPLSITYVPEYLSMSDA